MNSLAQEKAPLLIAGGLLVAAWVLGRRPKPATASFDGDAGADADVGGRPVGAGSSPGIKTVLIRVYKSLSTDRVLANAAGVTFYALLALFPALAALVSIYGMFADPAAISRQLEAMSGVLPGGAIDVIGQQMKRVAEQDRGALGIGAIFGLLVALWSANSGVKGLFDALNVVYGEKEKRGFFKLNAISLAFTIGAILFVIVAIGVIVALPIVLQYLPLRGVLEWLIDVLRWPIMLLVLIFGLALVYRFGPSRDRPRESWIRWGSVIAGILWVGASAAFSWYVANFGTYNETYGSLGAVIGFMTWMWISAIVILMGGELNAATEPVAAAKSDRGGHSPA